MSRNSARCWFHRHKFGFLVQPWAWLRIESKTIFKAIKDVSFYYTVPKVTEVKCLVYFKVNLLNFKNESDTKSQLRSNFALETRARQQGVSFRIQVIQGEPLIRFVKLLKAFKYIKKTWDTKIRMVLQLRLKALEKKLILRMI